MFTNKRYITRGASDKLPELIQAMLWLLIEEARREVKLDYLQVFDFKPYRLDSSEGPVLQRIIHFQEQPSYRRSLLISSENVIRNKFYAIDNSEYTTLLLSREY